ncbi:MAG: ATP-binding cassette domain-containing protein [Betaproteobacteria bacterium]|nr:ATP-binding cassette domain-containing protein [Betaproteobacteria bacterium]
MIKTSNLAYCYPSSSPIQFPDLDVAQGGVVLLSGPSGCGKSTWLALVAGLVKPRTGSLTVANQALGNLNGIAADAWRAKTIGFLPQKLHLSAALTVTQNLGMAQWAAGQQEDLARIDLTLQVLGVDELAHRKPSQLSGGQAQRVALARAVLLQPKIILADEPTASLDDEAAASAIELLVQTASKQGATLVIATHDGRVAPAIPPSKAGEPGYTALKLSRQSAGATI